MMESSANGTTELDSNLRYENSCNAIESENIVDCKQESNLIPTHSLIQEETNSSNLYTGTESIESSDFEDLEDPVMTDSFSQNQSQPDSSASSSRAMSSENCVERTQIENDSNPQVEIINTTTPEKTYASYEKDYNLKKLSVKLTRAKVHSVSYGRAFLQQLASDVYNDLYKQNKLIDLKKIYKLNIVSPYTNLTRAVFQRRLSYLLNKLIRENIKKEREERLRFQGEIASSNSKLDSAARLAFPSSYPEVHLSTDKMKKRKFRKRNPKSRKAIQATVAKAPRRLVQPRRHSVVNQPSCSFSRPDRMPSRQELKELKVCDPKVTHSPILHIPQPEQPSTGFQIPQPEQPSPIPSTGFQIPQPEQPSPTPSTDFRFLNQSNLLLYLSTGFQIPQPEQPSPIPSTDFRFLNQSNLLPIPSTGFQIPQPEQPSPIPSTGFQIPQPEQQPFSYTFYWISDSSTRATFSYTFYWIFQIPQPEQLSSSQPSTDFQIPKPEQPSPSPKQEQPSPSPKPEQPSSSPKPEQPSSSPTTCFEISQPEQLGSSPQPPRNFQNYLGGPPEPFWLKPSAHKCKIICS
ncbi:hypothetical protein CEXT_617381 [Caerostris extrusa]|uniref:Uncharacterized protein n=1 Tax=Caerostris extrusa TaxID=172846 RepID=A0AAV4XAA2_CAEEX|nr:hypothetical protein CEXT_617381 [Caerostris extrusa]